MYVLVKYLAVSDMGVIMKNVGILGFGVVGSGVAEVIAMNHDKIASHVGEVIQVKRVLDLREFPDSPFASLITHDVDEFFGDSDISIVVETIGGARIAYEFTKRALSLGKSVVTSNKELVSTHGVELMQLAEDNGCCYLFEAAVGGGIPIIRPLHRCLAANEIIRIQGIVNGTTNYILSSMRNVGLSYEDALKQAQQKGYAEQNPTADVDGIDAQRKLSILSSIALNGLYVSPDAIHAEGISSISLDDIEFADKIGCSVKLLASFFNRDGGKPSAFVAPFFVSKNELIASVEDAFNMIIVEGNALGEAMFYGQGAGKLPTASAVVGDVIDAALHSGRNPHITKWYVNADEESVIMPYSDVITNVVVKSCASNADSLMQTFSSFDCKVVCDDSSCSAVVVKGISHKEIEEIIASVIDGSWMHYMD